MFGEPLRSAFEPAEINEVTRSRSWRLIIDTNVEDWRSLKHCSI
jgi:hypothetical protein